MNWRVGVAIAIAIAAVGCLAAWWFSSSPDACAVLQTIDLGDGVRLQVVNDACKEGLPHTTDARTIRMTRGVWEGPRRDEILRHERVHLAQKGGLAAWRGFYQRVWEYECLSAPPADAGIPASLVERLRPNPDTADAPWALWRGRWLFFPVSRTEGALRDAEVVVWDVAGRQRVPIPPEWRAEFCEGAGGSRCPQQFEHPHEISAEWLTSRSAVAPAAAKLFAWKQ